MNMKKVARTGLLAALFAGSLFGISLAATSPASAHGQCGAASWYALHSRTASGAMMNPNAMTAAHRSLPFGTKLTVTNKRNGRSVKVTINDRGPFIKGRVIDLSRAAAEKLGFKDKGVAPVCFDAA